ncbi:MAG: Ig-like domain-containing protein [Clostridia bacterium]|nr:Ig-like domain-containing protein [Clostridia bacterium]
MKVKDIYKNKPLFITLIVSFVILLGAVITAGFLLTGHTTQVSAGKNIETLNLKNINIVPLVSDSAGVDLKSGFKVLCKENYSESTIRSALNITPKQNYKLERKSEKEFLVDFNTSMEPNKIYRFEVSGSDSLKKRSWAFQTKKTFKVMRTLPRDKGTSVPANTGIEISFNYENVESLDKFFKISPDTKGKFEYHKKTAVFVPERLEQNTVYTVTIKKGLGLKNSDETIQEDYVFQFQTESPQKPPSEDFFSFSDTLYNITSSVTPTFEIYASENLKNSEASIEIFKYPDENSFVENLQKYDSLPTWAYMDNDKIKFDTSKLEKVISFSTKILTGGNGVDWNYPHYLALPSTLQEGYYLISSTLNNIRQQTHLQVNNASVYVSVLKDKTLAWVNNSATGSPIEGATVQVAGVQQVKTGNDGIAIIPGQLPLPVTGSHFFMKIVSGKSPAFIARINSYYDYDYRYYNSDGYIENYNDSPNNSYWTYLYTDRGLYLPTDSVNIWGIVKPRDRKNPVTEAKLQLIPQNYYYANSDETSVIQSQDVALNEFGTFEGKLDFSNLSTGYYDVNLVYNNTVLSSAQFEIRQYTKPAYRIELQASRKVVFAGENLNFDIQASFFEGTPVSGLNLEYSSNTTSTAEGKLRCDKNGKAVFTATPSLGTTSWRPESLYMRVNNADSEEQEVAASSNIWFFPKDTMIQIDAKKKEGLASVDVKSSLIDLAGIYEDFDCYNPDKFRGAPVNAALKAAITEEHWEKTETGTYYDFINKKTGKTYDYYKVSTLVKSIDFTTSSGKYTFDFPIEKGRSYKITVTGFDSKKREILEEQTYYFDNEYNLYSLQREYQLENAEQKEFYKKGDKVSLNVKRNTENPPGPKSRCLYLTLQNGLLDYEILEGNSYSFDFNESMIPNVYVQAVYFDGTNIFNAGVKRFKYDYKQETLKITIKHDKQSYRPGDTVQLEVNVKDNSDKPCISVVNLSLVDEAFFALQDQYVDTLGDLYSYNLPVGLISDYVSYTPLYPNLRNNTAEEGGEGGDQPVIRSKFKDTAFFSSVKTDRNGKARVSFKLPDNLTSWRITYQGITDDIKAGSGKINISASLPFFTDIIFNNIFLTGDNPYITARSFGTELKTGSNIDYKLILEDEKGNKKDFTLKAPSGEFAGISLGKLDTGNYSVTVTATYGSYKDGIQKTFSVVDNILEASRSKSYKLKDDTKIEGGKSLTRLTFYNNKASFLYDTLNSLIYAWGERVDQKLSRKISQAFIKKFYGEENPWLVNEDEDLDFGKHQTADGGIALLSYDSSNPELSAKVCSVAKDCFDTNALKYYFYNILDNKDSTPEDVAASYWGLASLGEPVLLDIQSLLESTGIGIKEKLYLGIALSEIGDYSAAEMIYTKVINENGKSAEPYTFIDSGSTRDSSTELTALCSVIAMKINAPEKFSLYKYVKDNSTGDILTNLEGLMLVSNFVPDPLPTCKFSYVIDGTAKEVILEKQQTYQLTLTKDKLEEIKFSNISGDIAVTSSYTGPVKDLMAAPGNMIELKRSYSADTSDKTEFSRSDLVKITIHPEFTENAPDGFYEITDVLPAGFRFVEGDPFDDKKWYPSGVTGQKVVFSYYYGKNNTNFSAKEKYITYYARAVCPGTFTADNALIKHYDSDTTGFTDKQQIKIIN